MYKKLLFKTVNIYLTLHQFSFSWLFLCCLPFFQALFLKQYLEMDYVRPLFLKFFVDIEVCRSKIKYINHTLIFYIKIKYIHMLNIYFIYKCFLQFEHIVNCFTSDFAEDSMLILQLGCCAKREEELRTVVIFASIGHSEQSSPTET